MYAGTERDINKVNPTIMTFLELAVCVYLKVERPNATTRAHMKHRTEAANARGMDARSAPILPKSILVIFY